MNKHQRIQTARKIAEKRAHACGWEGPLKDLPEETQRAFNTTGNIRISRRGDRKGFHKTKRLYGHFSGYTFKNGTRQDLIERAQKNEEPTVR